MSIPRQLLTYLNSGKCFAVIGSGLSAAIGYPSWRRLAKDAAAVLPATHALQGMLGTLIDSADYPEVFQRVADELGGIHFLASELQHRFANQSRTGEAYEHICRWPIRCYLTTNYDDEITRHLSKLGEHFTTLHNSQADLAQVTSDTSRRVVKLHGDFSQPENMVLTTSQFADFETGGPRQYFRGKLTSVFQMVPVIVVGHSMADRDLQSILQLAKESASPKKPIFMIVADASPTDIEKLFREFNIRVLSYPNPDGTHKNLLQLLRLLNRFVVPRTSGRTPPLDFPEASDAATAVSLYVHSSLGFGANTELLQRTLQPQVLSLAAGQEDGIDTTEIMGRLKPETLAKEVQNNNLPNLRI